ncbi:MAG TPA: hypothetical protein VNA25_28395 [Phycisphaerae bacterium]|nr:hypothetical protein [Phycisphaerae bacterium]
MRTISKVLVAWAVFLCLVVAAHADTLILKDGRKFTGKLIQKDDKQVVFESHFGGSRMKLTFKASEVLTLTKGALPTTTKPAVKPAAGKLDLPPEPEAPPVVRHAGSTYYRIPLRGEVGKTVTAKLVEQSLADAFKRSPTVVVLEVGSPGGLIGEVEPILDHMRRYGKSLRIVVYVRNHAISAAAIFSLGAEEIYMHPSGLIGAATAFKMSKEGTPKDIAEKFQSIWRAMARRAAEQGKHSRLLAEAMIDQNLELHWVEQGGKKLVNEGTGKNVICRRGKLLTLTAGESVACGLSAGTADGYRELGKKMGLAGWTRCEGWAEALATHHEKVDELWTKVYEQYKANMRDAHETDPDQFTYTVWSHNKNFTPQSKRLWRERSVKCARYLLAAEKCMKKAHEMAEKYPSRGRDSEMLEEGQKEIKRLRTRIYQGASKTSPVTQ